MRLPNYDSVYVGDNEQLPPDGYVCKILNAKVEMVQGRDQLQVAVDIAEGDYKDFYKEKFERAKKSDSNAKWDFNAVYKRYILVDGSVSRGVKSLIEAVRESNPGYYFDPNNFEPKELREQLVGFTFGSTEYEGKDGKGGHFSTRVKFPCSVERIRTKKFRVPEVENLSRPSVIDLPGESVEDVDTPF